MKTLQPVSTIPGLAKEPERAVRDALNQLVAQVNLLKQGRKVTPLKVSSYVASEGEIVRIVAGVSLTLPRSRVENQGAEISVCLETDGTLRINAISSTINGETTATISDRKLITFISNGAGGWYADDDLSSSSSSDSIAVKDHGTTVIADADTLNFADSLSVTNSRVGQADVRYVGTTSTITLSGITGNQGTIDISTLECGGQVLITGPTGDWSIEGFTARADGFWFIVTQNNTNFHGTLFNEDATATSTNRIRLPSYLDYSTYNSFQAKLQYSGTRWRCTPGGQAPFHNAPANTTGDMLAHDGTNWAVVTIAANSFPARVGAGVVSHPFSTLAGNGLDYSSGVIDVDVDEAAHLVDVGGGNSLGFRKSRQRHFFFDDFDYIDAKDTGGASTTTITTAAQCVNTGQGEWGIIAVDNPGSIAVLQGENNHLGILQLNSSAVSGDGLGIYRGTFTVATGFIQARDIYSVEAVLRLFSAANVLMRFGLVEVPSLSGAVTEGAYFDFDTTVDAQIHARTIVTPGAAGDITDTNTGTAPGTGWNVYTIIQETVGTFTFYIDDILEATHTTDIPSAQPLNLYITVTPRTAAAKSLDIDYVSLESQPLGDRTA